MANNTTLAVLSTTIILASCGKEQPQNQSAQVPDAVRTAFQKEHGTPKSMTWEQEGGYYEAEFNVNGVEHEAMYDAQGALVATAHAIAASDLPVAVAQTIATTYPGGTLGEMEVVEQGGNTQYEVEVLSGGQQYEVVLAADGTIQSQEIEVETDEEDGEEENEQ